MATLRDFMFRFEKKAKRIIRGEEFLEYLSRDIDDPEDWERRLSYPLEEERDFIKFTTDEIEVFFEENGKLHNSGIILLRIVENICRELGLVRNKVM